MNPNSTNEILSVAAQLVHQAIHEDDKGNHLMATALRQWAMRLRRAIDGKAVN